MTAESTGYICKVCRRRIDAQRAGVRLAQQQSTEAKRLQADGMSIRTIALEIGVPEGYVYKLLQPKGVFTRSPGPGRRPLPIDPAELRLLVDAGKSTAEIAAILGCGISTVSRHLAKMRANG